MLKLKWDGFKPRALAWEVSANNDRISSNALT